MINIWNRKWKYFHKKAELIKFLNNLKKSYFVSEKKTASQNFRKFTPLLSTKIESVWLSNWFYAKKMTINKDRPCDFCVKKNGRKSVKKK